MSGFLLDTNIISEVRKGSRADPKVVAWYYSVDFTKVHLSVLVLGEIRAGIESCRSRDPLKADKIEQWLLGLQSIFAAKILPVTTPIADRWGRLSAPRPLSFVDGLLAATAIEHGLTLVTRNGQDVQDTGVALLNPFV